MIWWGQFTVYTRSHGHTEIPVNYNTDHSHASFILNIWEMQKDLKMQSITKKINEMIKIQYITLNDQQ